MGNELKRRGDFSSERIFNLGMSAVGIAHDLNNFLCAIIAYADMALEDSVDPKISGNLNCLLTVSEQARLTVEDILCYARSQEPCRGKVDLANVVDKAMNFIRTSTSASLKLIFENHCASSILVGNENQLYQCVMNLALNGVQSMNNSGTLMFVLKNEFVHHECNGAIGRIYPGEYLVLEVTDTGSGIDPELMDKIFQPFFSTKVSSNGCGLGLAIIVKIMTNCQGNILVRSSAGIGTSFSLYFPSQKT
jgi:signal transduction histidine kinase